MHKTTILGALAAAVLALSGCAGAPFLSDAALRDKAALGLDLPPASVVVADRRFDGLADTFFTARTPQGAYHCLVNGGTALSFGISSRAQCTR